MRNQQNGVITQSEMTNSNEFVPSCSKVKAWSAFVLIILGLEGLGLHSFFLKIVYCKKKL